MDDRMALYREQRDNSNMVKNFVKLGCE